MIFNVLLLSLSLIGSSTALPSASASNSLAILAARGIDPSGPIPADAVALPGGGFSFAADSDTAHWVRAGNSDLTKRENSGLTVSMWSAPSCAGSGAVFPNMVYGQQSIGGLEKYISYEFRGRALLQNEQLDLSVIAFSGGDKCAKFVKTIKGGSAPGCLNQVGFSCMRLTHF